MRVEKLQKTSLLNVVIESLKLAIFASSIYNKKVQ